MKTKDLIERFEKTFREEKLKEAEELHNAIGSVLEEHRPEIQTALYVLELIKFELLKERYCQLFEENHPTETKPGKT